MQQAGRIQIEAAVAGCHCRPATQIGASSAYSSAEFVPHCALFWRLLQVLNQHVLNHHAIGVLSTRARKHRCSSTAPTARCCVATHVVATRAGPALLRQHPAGNEPQQRSPQPRQDTTVNQPIQAPTLSFSKRPGAHCCC